MKRSQTLFWLVARFHVIDLEAEDQLSLELGLYLLKSLKPRLLLSYGLELGVTNRLQNNVNETLQFNFFVSIN